MLVRPPLTPPPSPPPLPPASLNLFCSNLVLAASALVLLPAASRQRSTVDRVNTGRPPRPLWCPSPPPPPLLLRPLWLRMIKIGSIADAPVLLLHALRKVSLSSPSPEDRNSGLRFAYPARTVTDAFVCVRAGRANTKRKMEDARSREGQVSGGWWSLARKRGGEQSYTQ